MEVNMAIRTIEAITVVTIIIEAITIVLTCGTTDMAMSITE